jgi:propanediol utilization protein
MAKKLGLKHRESISLQHLERPDIVLHHVLVRVHPTFACELHLSSDEAARHWLSNDDVFILCS